MSKIYAPVDAVNRHKDITTTLPEDLVLSAQEKKELYDVEQILISRGSYAFDNSRLSVLFARTTNQGLMFFAIENNLCLDKLGGNVNLPTSLAFLLSTKIAHQKSYNSELIHSLMLNPVVLRNQALFPVVWSNVISGVNHSTGFSSILILGSFLLKHNWLEDNQKLLVFTTLLPFVENKRFAPAIQKEYGETAIGWLKENEPIIREWLAQENPDLVDLPLEWILALWGMIV